MKVYIFIGLILVVLFVSGSKAPSQPVDTVKLNIDSILIEHAAQRYVDSIARPKELQLDTLKLFVDSVKQERGKKKFVGHVDTWPSPDGKRHVWKWIYWRYPDGRVKFYKPIKSEQ